MTYHAVPLKAVPLIHRPFYCLLVIWEVVIESDMASHVPKETLLVLDCAGKTSSIGFLEKWNN